MSCLLRLYECHISRIAPEEMVAILWALTYFLHNVSATVSYDPRKELLDIRTAITHLVLDKDFFFKESDASDLLQTLDKSQIPIICMKKRQISVT